MYRCQHFDLRELVPEREFRVMGYKAWWLLDSRLLMTLDVLREQFGPVVMNTWWSPKLIEAYGWRAQAGFRTSEYYESTAEYLSSHSQHKYGRAADCLFVDISAAAVRESITRNVDMFPSITAVESYVPWLHIDVRNCESVLVF